MAIDCQYLLCLPDAWGPGLDMGTGLPNGLIELSQQDPHSGEGMRVPVLNVLMSSRSNLVVVCECDD